MSKVKNILLKERKVITKMKRNLTLFTLFFGAFFLLFGDFQNEKVFAIQKIEDINEVELIKENEGTAYVNSRFELKEDYFLNILTNSIDTLKTKNEELSKELVEMKNEKELIEEKRSQEEYELYLLAKIINCEEGTQNITRLNEKVAVGIVVLNRMNNSERFPDDIESVIHQKNQFSPSFDGSWEEKEPKELDYIAAEIALSNEIKITGKNGKEITEALYFMNPKLSEPHNVKWFRENLEYIDTVGDHEYFKEKTK